MQNGEENIMKTAMYRRGTSTKPQEELKAENEKVHKEIFQNKKLSEGRFLESEKIKEYELKNESERMIEEYNKEEHKTKFEEMIIKNSDTKEMNKNETQRCTIEQCKII